MISSWIGMILICIAALLQVYMLFVLPLPLISEDDLDEDDLDAEWTRLLLMITCLF